MANNSNNDDKKPPNSKLHCEFPTVTWASPAQSLQSFGGSDYRDRFSKINMKNKSPFPEESKCTCPDACPCTRATINFNSDLQASGNSENPTLDRKIRIKLNSMGQPSCGSSQLFRLTTLESPQLCMQRREQSSGQPENMNYGKSISFLCKSDGSSDTENRNEVPTVEPKEYTRSQIFNDERITQLLTGHDQSSYPNTSTSFDSYAHDVHHPKPPKSRFKTLKQRNHEMHEIRMAVEVKRIELLKLKKRREKNEMARDLILFEKELEIKEAALRQLKGERP